MNIDCFIGFSNVVLKKTNGC